jgi:hypothetical protein
MIAAGNTLVSQGVTPVGDQTFRSTRTVRLPGGVNYPAGQVLGEVQTAKRNEVHRITVGDPSGGTWQLMFAGNLLTAAMAHNANAAAIQTAINAVLGAGAVAVSGTGPIDITYSGAEYANRELAVPQLISNLTGGSTARSIAVQTRGSAGPVGCAAAYNSGVNDGRDAAKWILAKPVRTAFNGAIINEFGPGDLYTTAAYDRGDFLCSDLTGIDGTNVSQLGRLVSGASVSVAGAIVRVGV